MIVLNHWKAATLLLVMLLTFGQALAGYQFEFRSTTDTVKQVAPGAVAEFGFSLTNTGTEPDGYEFDLRVIQSVPSWYVTYCVGFH
ncbi:MAG: hypothetical protein ABIL25_02085 [candidate division WOR-3 bacterium]